ncbi:ribosome 60S biogenesis N-terminal-domain-containing protein [Lipomyces oligophaga]|uniref:ribosome 60S biogenesis N-terminal-domain-containing protein n=1 Tax=Lipomyces oligophaga TaxID=45792 RepID=UPI0034CF6004
MSHKKQKLNKNKSLKDNELLDPTFLTLELLIGLPFDTSRKFSRESYDQLVAVLENGLSFQLIAAWAKIGQVSVTTSSFKDVTLRLRYLIHLLNQDSLSQVQGQKMIRAVLDQHLKLIFRALYTRKPMPVVELILLLQEFALYQNSSFADDLVSTLDFSSLIYKRLLTVPRSTISSESMENHESGSYNQNHSLWIRSTLVNFLLVLLKFGSRESKIKLLSSSMLFNSWISLSYLDDIEQMENTVTQLYALALDKVLDKVFKRRIFTEWTLARILSIYRVLKKKNRLGVVNINLILNICLKPICGVFYPDNGWYLPGMLEGVKPKKAYRVYNRVIYSFSKNLDITDTDELYLLKALFESCPEIVAAYVSSVSIKSDPAQTINFLNFIAFNSEIISLRIPKNISDFSLTISIAPPVEIVLENVFPSYITRILIEKSIHWAQLPRYFIMTLIIQGIRKLRKVSDIFEKRGWVEPSQHLKEEAFRRFPELSLFSNLTKLQLSASTRLSVAQYFDEYLDMYPRISANAHPDCTSLLSSSEKYISELDRNAIFSSELLELRTMLGVQSRLPISNRFWNRIDQDQHCCFVSLLRLATEIMVDDLSFDIVLSLDRIIKSTDLFLRSSVSILIPIRDSLKHSLRVTSSDEMSTLWYLIDESISRCFRSPFKYIDKSFINRTGGQRSLFSPFFSSLAEQWLYLSRSKNPTRTPSWAVFTSLIHLIFSCSISVENWDLSFFFCSLITNSDRYYVEVAKFMEQLKKFSKGTSPSITTKCLLFAKSPDLDDKDCMSFILSCSSEDDLDTFKSQISRSMTTLDIFSLFARRRFSNQTKLEINLLVNLLPKILNSDRFSQLGIRLILQYEVQPEWLVQRKEDLQNEYNREFTAWYLRVVAIVFTRNDCSDAIFGDYIWKYISICIQSQTELNGLEQAVSMLSNERRLQLLQLLDDEDAVLRWISRLILKVEYEDDELQNLARIISWSTLAKLIHLALQVQQSELSQLVECLVKAFKSVQKRIDWEWHYNDTIQFSDKHAFNLLQEVMSISTHLCESVLRIDENRIDILSPAISLELLKFILSYEVPLKTLFSKDTEKKIKRMIADSFQKIEISDLLRNYSVYHNFCRYLDSKVDINALVNRVIVEAPHSYAIEKLTYLSELSTNEEARSFIALSTSELIKNQLQLITKVLAEQSILSRKHRKLIQLISAIIANLSDHLSLSMKQVNAAIEVSIQHWLLDPEIVLFISTLVRSFAKSKDFEGQKSFQLILGNDNLLNGNILIEAHLVNILHILYFANPRGLLTSNTAVKLIQFYGGSISRTDYLIYEILHSIDALSNLSIALKISSYTFSDDTSAGKVYAGSSSQMLQLVFSRKRFQSSISALVSSKRFPKVDRALNAQSDTSSIGELSLQHSLLETIYDPLFALSAITDMITRRLVDIAELVDNYAVGYIIVCSSNDDKTVRLLARKVLLLIITYIEESTYKERDHMRVLLYHVFFLVDSSTELTSNTKLILRIVSSFVPVLANVGHYLYEEIAELITSKPELSREEIPLLRSSLPSSNQDHYGQITNWILESLIRTLNSIEDLTLFDRSFVFEIVQTLQNQSLSAKSTMKLVSELIDKARSVIAS